MIMKPFLERVETDSANSIKVRHYEQAMIEVPLHFHPEHELVYVQKGHGRLLLGDVEGRFGAGEMFFIPGSVPHLFSDEYMRTGKHVATKVFVIQFKESLTENFMSLPEFGRVRSFIESAGAGYRIQATPKLIKGVRRMELLRGLPRFILLLEMINEVVEGRGYEPLGVLSNKPLNNHIAFLRLQKLNAFLNEYAENDITIREASDLLNMNTTSFCRFLRRETGKTFSEHLCFYRINHACKLLRETGKPVVEICYEAGFNNPSYFFRRFKAQIGKSPALYRQESGRV